MPSSLKVADRIFLKTRTTRVIVRFLIVCARAQSAPTRCQILGRCVTVSEGDSKIPNFEHPSLRHSRKIGM